MSTHFVMQQTNQK